MSPVAVGLPCTGPRDCLDAVKSIPGDIVGGAAGSAIDALADSVTEAVGKAVASVGTLWVKVGTPNLTTNGGTRPSEAVGFLQGGLWWYMAAAAVLSVIIAGAKMAWEGRAEPGRELLKSLMTLVVVAGAGLTAISLAVAAADGFAKWIIDSSLDGTDFGTNITALLGLSAVSGFGAIIVIVLGLAAFVAALVQIGLMVVRGGMLVILAGILPLSASATNTEWGRTWFRKCIAWLVAFILYKPAAAIVYATAFRLAGSDVFGGDELMSAISGLVLMVLALVALPALMRFVTPMVGAMAGSGSGGGGMMAAGAIAAMPSGAMRVPRGGGAGAVAGNSGGSGPTGATDAASGGGRGGGGGGGGGTPAGGGSSQKGGVNSSTAGGGVGDFERAKSAANAASPAGAPAAVSSASGPGAVSGSTAGTGVAGAAAARVAKGAKNAAQGAAETQTEDGGPSGSR
jgi:type IV secretion system protein TrbL